MPREERAAQRIVWIKLDCSPEFLLSRRPVPVVLQKEHRAHRVRFGKRRIYLQSLLDGLLRFWDRIFRREDPIGLVVITKRQTDVSQREVRVFRNRLLE